MTKDLSGLNKKIEKLPSNDMRTHTNTKYRNTTQLKPSLQSSLLSLHPKSYVNPPQPAQLG
jgi:hypothetical protein